MLSLHLLSNLKLLLLHNLNMLLHQLSNLKLLLLQTQVMLVCLGK